MREAVAIDTKETASIIQSSKDNNTTFLEGMWMRYLPHIEYVKKAIEKTKLEKSNQFLLATVKI